MLRQSSGSRGPYRKPRPDIYTVMLALSLVAIIIGCIVLFLEVADYGDPPYELGSSASFEPNHATGPALAWNCQPATAGDRCPPILWKT